MLIVIAQSVPQAALALVDVLTKVRIGRHDRSWTLYDRLLTQLRHLFDDTIILENDNPCAQVDNGVHDTERPCKWFHVKNVN